MNSSYVDIVISDKVTKFLKELFLEKEGSAEIYYGEESGGPGRKYYRLTRLGREALERAVKEWNRIRNIVDTIGI